MMVMRIRTLCALVGLLCLASCDSSVDPLGVAHRTLEDDCFKTITWVPNTRPPGRCDCDPYDTCESTLLGEQCNNWRAVGSPKLDVSIVPHLCPDFQIGTRVSIWRKQKFVQDCTIAYDCGNGPCAASGQKSIMRKKLVFEATVCPEEITIRVDKLSPAAGVNPIDVAAQLSGLGPDVDSQEALSLTGIDIASVPDDPETDWQDVVMDADGVEVDPDAVEPVGLEQ